MSYAERFNPNHAPPGSAAGGQFASAASSGSQAQAQAKPGGSPAQRRMRKARLLAEAHSLRDKARILRQQMHRLEHQHQQVQASHAAAAKQAAHHTAQAKKQAKGPAAGAAGHTHRTTSHHRMMASHHQAHAATLAERIRGLRREITKLIDRAKTIEAEAAKL